MAYVGKKDQIIKREVKVEDIVTWVRKTENEWIPVKRKYRFRDKNGNLLCSEYVNDEISIEKGNTITIRGRVVCHRVRNGEEQTVLDNVSKVHKRAAQ